MRKYLFGDFELDLDAFGLRLRGEPVKLERRPLDLLVLLVQHSGRMVPREEIIAALWPTGVVIDFESGLNTLVRKLRNALGDSSANPKFIETVPGRGYRFVAAVTVVTETESEREPLPTESTIAKMARARLLVPIAVSLSLLITVAAIVNVWRNIDTDHEPRRIAVLPFENLMGGDELTYLASGLAEDTSISLGQIDPDSLRVIGSSAGEAIDPALPITDIGRKLGVDFVVLGSLRLEQPRIRLTWRLLRVADGEQIGGDSFDRELTNVLGLQRELSTAIAQQTRLRLSPEVAAAIDRRQTQNPAAYALYLKGRYEWMRLTPDSMERAIGYFEQAVAEDPTYALAWAGIAFAAITSVRTADTEPAVAKPIALAALQRAEQLGPDLAETHYARGYYSLFGDLDRFAAERFARKAIALDPNNAQAHMLLGAALARERMVETLEMMRRTRELDPTFALGFANSANFALMAGDVSGAMEFAIQTVAMSREFWLGHYYLGRARQTIGDTEAALSAYADASRLSDGHSLTYSARVDLLVTLGRINEARTLVAELTTRAAHRYVPPLTLALVNVALGETDAAFHWLERAVEARDVGLPSLPTEPRLQALRDDPRFEALLARCSCGASAEERL